MDSTIDTHLVIDSAEGPIPVFAARPEGLGPFPVVILYMDIFGPREELFAMCRRFADNGFLALLPNLFHRLGSPVFPPANAREDILDPVSVAANDATSTAMSSRDTQAIVDFVEGGGLGVEGAGYNAIGYCMGGRHALAAVATCEAVKAGISAHAGRLVDNSSASAHLMVAGLAKPFHFYFAVDDETCPDAHREMVVAEAEKAGPNVRCELLQAPHGWSFVERWAYDEAASELVWGRAISLFGG